MTRAERKDRDQEFQLWKEYQDIAVGFHDLIIQLRVKSLGGVAAIIGLFGALVKLGGSTPTPWGAISAVFAVLSLAWAAIAALDGLYYSRLLDGAVKAIKELERNGGRIELTCRIVEQTDRWWVRGREVFYIAIFAGLSLAWMLSTAEYCRTAGCKALVHKLGVCDLVEFFGI